MKKELTPGMEKALARIRAGHFHLVDKSSAKALARRGLIRISGHPVSPRYEEVK